MSQHQFIQQLATNPLLNNNQQLLINKKTAIIDKENITPSTNALKSSQKPLKKESNQLKPSNKLQGGDLKRKFQSTTTTQPATTTTTKSSSPLKKKKFSIFQDKSSTTTTRQSSPPKQTTLEQIQSSQISHNTTTSTTTTPNSTTTTTTPTIDYEIVEEECIIQPYLERIRILEDEIVELTNDKTYYQLMYNTLSIDNDARFTIDGLKKQISLLENTKNVFRSKIVSLSKEKEALKIQFEQELDLQKQAAKHLRDLMQQEHEEQVLQLQSEIEQLKQSMKQC